MITANWYIVCGVKYLIYSLILTLYKNVSNRKPSHHVRLSSKYHTVFKYALILTNPSTLSHPKATWLVQGDHEAHVVIAPAERSPNFHRTLRAGENRLFPPSKRLHQRHVIESNGPANHEFHSGQRSGHCNPSENRLTFVDRISHYKSLQTSISHKALFLIVGFAYV